METKARRRIMGKMVVERKTPQFRSAPLKVNVKRAAATRGDLPTPRAKRPAFPILLPNEGGENLMLSWALTFLVVALIAGLLGFVGIAGTAAEIAKILFLVFLVLFVISLLMGRRTPPVG